MHWPTMAKWLKLIQNCKNAKKHNFSIKCNADIAGCMA